MNNEEMKTKLKECSKELSRIRDLMDVDNLSLKVDALERISEEDDFWDDTDNASKTLEEINDIKMNIDNYMKLKSFVDDMDVKVQINVKDKMQGFDDEFNNFLADFKLKLLDLNLKL